MVSLILIFIEEDADKNSLIMKYHRKCRNKIDTISRAQNNYIITVITNLMYPVQNFDP